MGYISVVESLKIVTDTTITTTTTVNVEEKYRVVAPEAMQEIFMSDSEDEGGQLLNFYFPKNNFSFFDSVSNNVFVFMFQIIMAF